MEELFEQIIYQAIKKNVSDIHLQCTEKGVIKFRICGELLTYETYEKTNIIQLMNYIRFISKIDLNYYRKPQTGHYVYVLNNKKYEIAIENPINNEYEVLKGESISIINTNINQNYYEYNKKHYHDIINPKTLMPANNFVGVTVITNQIKDAFVLSKFIFLSSFENGKNLVKENKNLEVKWYIDENKIEETSNFNKYE